MRKLIALWLFIPLLGMSQNKNVINVTRVFPKIEKLAEFEKALAAHAQKFHIGDWKWRVSEIQSGPDAGGFSIVEGPTTWDQFDKRGNLGQEHTNDWNKNVAAHLSQKYASSYLEYNEELSNGQYTDYSDKFAVNHIFLKPGMIGDAEENIKSLKKLWVADNQTVIVLTASSSGPVQYILVTRYKQGLKEREVGFRKPFPERFVGANGAGSFHRYVEAIQKYTDHSWSELLFYRADLSSK